MTTFQKLNKTTRYVKYSQAKPGDVLVEGLYISSELETNKFDPSKQVMVHKFSEKEGEITVLNHAGQLNHKLKSFNPGDIIRVTFLGKEKYLDKQTGQLRTANQFDVEVADELEQAVDAIGA